MWTGACSPRHGNKKYMKTTLRTLALGTVIPLIFAPANSFAKDKHYDPYVQGPDRESELIREVRHRLVMLPYYGVFDDIGFNVTGTSVTLVGQVRQPVLKTDAGKAVSKIEGVTNVVNNIEVLPLSPEDDRVRRDVYRAIFSAADIGDRYGFSAVPAIHIIVKNGNVRLEGVVANEFDRNIINIKAKGVPGAFSVEDDLQVEAKK
jgi:hyperosmotically inducible periplasmic protein